MMMLSLLADCMAIALMISALYPRLYVTFHHHTLSLANYGLLNVIVRGDITVDGRPLPSFMDDVRMRYKREMCMRLRYTEKVYVVPASSKQRLFHFYNSSECSREVQSALILHTLGNATCLCATAEFTLWLTVPMCDCESLPRFKTLLAT